MAEFKANLPQRRCDNCDLASVGQVGWVLTQTCEHRSQISVDAETGHPICERWRVRRKRRGGQMTLQELARETGSSTLQRDLEWMEGHDDFPAGYSREELQLMAEFLGWEVEV